MNDPRTEFFLSGAADNEGGAIPDSVLAADAGDIDEYLAETITFFRQAWARIALMPLAEADETINRLESELKEWVWGLRTLAFAQTVPDYEQVVATANVPIPAHIADYLKTSPHGGAALAYYLAQNLDTCQRIAEMPAPRAIEMLKMLESKLKRPRLRLVHCMGDSSAPRSGILPLNSRVDI